MQTPASRFYILVGFLAVCTFTGGSSRPDAGLLLILRPVMVVLLAALLIASPRVRLGEVHPIVVMLALFAGTMAIQLVPLPPALWLALPGHAGYGEAAEAAGVAQSWRPLSLTPDLTLNSLVSLMPALFIMIAFAGIERRQYDLVLVPLIIAGISVVIGLVQIAGGPDSPAYFYRPTSDLLPVGLFANRNHQAAMLAIALPALAVWARHPNAGRYRLAMAGGACLLLLPVILVTGSRAGMVLGGIGMIFAFILVAPALKALRISRSAYVIAAALVLVVIVATMFAGRAISVDRLSEIEGPTTELRFITLPIVLAIIRDHLPFGVGYGAFDQAFRGYEPDFLLRPTFFNRAHDDVLETILSGGVPALIVMALFAAWCARQTIRAWRKPLQDTYVVLMARLGSAIVIMLVLASLVDYPLRTPLAGVMFALACCWLARAGRDGGPDTRDGAPAHSIAFRRRGR